MLEVIILLLRVSLGCGGLGERPRAAKWLLPAHALWKCWEGAGASPRLSTEQSCDTLSIPISHFLGFYDTRMAQSPPAVAQCQRQSGTGPGPSLLASYSSISSVPSHSEMRFLFLWQLQEETPWTVQESQHKKNTPK